MNNGLLRYGSLLDAVPPVLLPHSPSWFSATKFPYNFDPKAQCPNWLRFLHQNLEGDAERIALMQEWFGYSLIPDTRQQKFMVLDGEGANGKSVVCAAYTAMLGMDNCAFVPLESFGERFQLTQTLGKLANIAPECGEIDRVAEGVLKSFTSGDSMFFDRKHKSPIQARPTARFMLATNNRPRFSDRSSGLWRRMIIVPFHVTIQQADRILGMDKAEYWQDELPGILNWALEGLRRLRMEGQFTRPRVCEEAIAAYRLDCNPAAEFLNENYRADATQSVVCQELYKHYQAWCLEHGYQPLGDNKFGVEVGRAFSQVQRKRTGSVDRKYVYMGVGRASVAGWQQAPLPFRKAN
jgi:putative DNA primase/helicase